MRCVTYHWQVICWCYRELVGEICIEANEMIDVDFNVVLLC